jgi:hypothetical protein
MNDVLEELAKQAELKVSISSSFYKDSGLSLRHTETIFAYLVSILVRWMCKNARNTCSFIPNGTLYVGINAGIFVDNWLHTMKLYKNTKYYYEAYPNTKKVMYSS